MQGADYRYGGLSDPYADVAYGNQRQPQDPYGRAMVSDPYPRDSPSKRTSKPDPYSQQRSIDSYAQMQPKESYGPSDYPVRAPSQKSVVREDPYSRQARTNSARQQQQQQQPYRNDVYPRDDSLDGRDAPSPFSSTPDYRRQRNAGDSAQKSGQLQSYQKIEPVMSFIRGPSVVYELDHLATFTVNRKQNLYRPEDGVRRLREMEATSGVWAMRVQLKIDSREIVVIEKAENKELECFAVSQVTDPVCMVLESNDLFNNVVVFTVKKTPAEMHLFQCVGKPGNEVVEDITAAISGKFPRQPPAPKVVPVPRVPSSHSFDDDRSLGSSFDERPVGGFDDAPVSRNQFNRPFQNNGQLQQYNGNDVGGPGFNAPQASTQPPANNDADVALLNRLFDDLEGFVARLQLAANAYKELNRRLAMSGGQDPTVEILRAQSRPPQLEDFVDALQKFKVTINLLSLLRSSLKDPDAAQLTHSLFKLLKVVTDACRDERGALNVVQKVESPMLTGDTCLFLETQLFPDELQLWQSFGPAWTTPGHLWNGVLTPYVPRFKDGGQPSSVTTGNTPGPQPSSFGRPSVQDQGMMYGNLAGVNSSGQSMAPTPFGATQFESQPPQNQWQGRQSTQQVPQSNYPAVGQGPTPGQYQAGQTGPAQGFQPGFGANVIQEPVGGMKAMESSTLPTAIASMPKSESSAANPSQLRFLNELKAKEAMIYIVSQGRDGLNQKELTVQTGDVVEVLDSSKNWWKVRSHIDQIGFVPKTFLSAYSG